MDGKQPIVAYVKDRDNWKMLVMSAMFVAIVILTMMYSCTREDLNKCLQGCEGKERIIRDTIVKADSIPYEVLREVPVPKYVKVPDKSLQAKVDSLIRENKALDALLDYYATRYYADTLLNDSSALIALFDTVSENAIQGRRLMFQNRQPAVIRETIITEKELRFKGYYGAAIKYNQETGQLSAEAKLNFIPKNDRVIVEVSYDPFNQTWGAGASFKIGGR